MIFMISDVTSIFSFCLVYGPKILAHSTILTCSFYCEISVLLEKRLLGSSTYKKIHIALIVRTSGIVLLWPRNITAMQPPSKLT